MKTRIFARLWSLFPRSVVAAAAMVAAAGATASAQDGALLDAAAGKAVSGFQDPNTQSLGALDPALTDPLYGGYPNYSSASTYEESVMRGQGAQFAGAGQFIQSVGQANYLTAQGMVAAEQARSLYLDNVKKHAQTYWQRRAIYQSGRQMVEGQRPTAEDLARFARARAPEGLTVSDYDPTTGALQWPEALQAPEFESQRLAIEWVVKNHGIGASGVEALAEQMEARLKTRVDDLDPADYIASKNFLTGLAVESSATPRRAEAVAAVPSPSAIVKR